MSKELDEPFPEEEDGEDTTYYTITLTRKATETIVDLLGSGSINDEECNLISQRIKNSMKQQTPDETEKGSVVFLINGAEVDLYNRLYGPEFFKEIKGAEVYEDKIVTNNEDLSIAIKMFADYTPHVDPAKRTVKVTDELLEALYTHNEEMLEFKSECMQIYREVNLAFVRAGGRARPDFQKYYEGPLPNS